MHEKSQWNRNTQRNKYRSGGHTEKRGGVGTHRETWMRGGGGGIGTNFNP